MLKTERMTRTLVMGTMDAMNETVDFLYNSRVFHVINYKKDDVYDIGTPLPEADEASRKLLKMMSISSNLELDENAGVGSDEIISVEKIKSEIDAALTHLDLEIGAEVHSRIELSTLLAKKQDKMQSLEPFSDFDFSLALLKDFSSSRVFCGKLKSDPTGDIRKLTDAFDLISGEEIMILIVEKSFEAETLKVLVKHGFTEMPIPDIVEKPGLAIMRLKKEIAGLEKKLESINTRITDLKDRHGTFITASVEELTIEANRAEAPLKFGTASYSFVIDAWAPTKSLEKLREGLSKIEKGTVVLVDIETPEGEEPPILMDNPKAVRPMQMLLDMFSLPSYGEIDPAFFMFLTFPLFYGLMLGDIGYGIVIFLMVVTGALTKLMTKLGMAGGAPGLSRILLYCSIMSIIFGFLYNEFFGFELFALHGGHGAVTVIFPNIEFPVFTIPKLFIFGPIEFPILRGEPEMVTPMLLFCVWIGIFHIMLGYIIGFVNAWMNHGPKHAILEKGGWCLILAGLAMFAFKAMPDLMSGAGLQLENLQIQLGLGLLIAGIVMAFSVEGINTLLELPGLSGNLLSYTRIYAIGLSSIAIAVAFNEDLALPAIEGGGIGVVVGVLVLIAGHALNIGLGIIGPLIQTLRLHYVEFFTKFYKGGGEKFNPLKYTRKHTKEV